MPNAIETKGREILKQWLTKQGRTFSDSDDRTFDLIVDGVYAELKSKGYGWDRFDFIGLTKNQQQALGNKLQKIFVVLNVHNPAKSEIVEIEAKDLIQCDVKKIVHYEWNKGAIAPLRERVKRRGAT